MAGRIGTRDIAASEVLAGVSYTEDERALIAEGIEAQILSAAARRAVRFDNADPPALRFDPRLGDFRMPDPGPLRFSQVDPGPLPDDPEDIAFAPLPVLSAWLSRGALTSRALTEIYLTRIEALNPRLFCFATVTPHRALAEADRADQLRAAGTDLGPLHGIPYALKDLFDTEGIATGWGAEPFRDCIPDRDAAVVERLRDAGAVLLGKSTLGALAMGDVWYGGTTRNPWNLNEGSGGSSAGSASAVAAGLCGFAIGTETLGSITNPSERCGATGLRPTFGRVPRRGAMALCPSLDKIGPICRGVEDTAMVLAALNGAEPGDRDGIEAPFSYDAGAGVEGLRLGYLPEAFDDAAGAIELDRATLEAARGLGVTLKEIRLPDLPYAALMEILSAEAAAIFEDLTLGDVDDQLTRQDAGAWPNRFRMARFLSAVDHVQLDRLRYRVMQAMDAVFRDVDAVIGPFNTGPMLLITNMTGHPCLHLRAGFVQSGTRPRNTLGAQARMIAPGPPYRVPHGISLWGRLFDEGTILRLGRALEARLGVAAQRPGLPE
ncbi:amidase [Allgaiera indica]|uniref:Amidase n=1 Tax=Allgaiera indica TaxID=765699 RepID=A0AAN4UPY2_9RHOB|nr:amidase [Allgaiera indica]GHE00410.1 amidase [Allgaiera indica]SDW62376.1 Asp-tRNAAsn/Glu-tRNAGln amidotransferase A subunit [Allgaiera indica]